MRVHCPSLSPFFSFLVLALLSNGADAQAASSPATSAPTSIDISQFEGSVDELEALTSRFLANQPNPSCKKGPSLPSAPDATCEDPRLDPAASSRALLGRYWSAREALREHFVRSGLDERGELTSDGIGEWDPSKRRYSMAGFGYPAAQLVMTWNPPGGDGLPNYHRSGDMGLNLGRYLGMLATEYELLGRHGQFEAQKRTLGELFMALQAYRRSDMTANRLWQERMQTCESSTCDFVADLSGSSGWFIRDDIPGDFHRHFDTDVEPAWQIGATQSDYQNDAAGLPCQSFPSPLSQDQVIGLLHGLALVHRFVPDEIELSVEGRSYRPAAMAADIAEGMVRRIRDARGKKIRYPECSGQPVERGASAGWLLHGMIEVANSMLPENRQISSSFGLEVQWGAARAGILATDGWGNPDNVRMLLSLLAAGDIRYNNAVRKQAQPLWWMQHLSHAVLHDKPVSEGDLDLMARMLCAYRCQGPCYQSDDYSRLDLGPAFACSNVSVPEADGETVFAWCRDFWKRGTGCNQGFAGMRQPGISFMLAYNLHHLAGGTAYGDYYDPSRIESSPWLRGPELDLEGPESAPAVGEAFEVRVLGDAIGPFRWVATAGLEIIEVDPVAGRWTRIRGLAPGANHLLVQERRAPVSECDRLLGAQRSFSIAAAPVEPPLPDFNGSRPGFVSFSSDEDPRTASDRCVANPIDAIERGLVSSPETVSGYRSGKSRCGVAAPWSKNGLNHRQGVQRLRRHDADGVLRNYLVVSNSTRAPWWAGFEVVELESGGAASGELGPNLADAGACPQCRDRIVHYRSREFFRHADGIQVLGNRYLSVGYADPDRSLTDQRAQWCLYDLSDPTSSQQLSCTEVSSGWASTVAITRLNDGRFMAWAFGKDTASVEIFTADTLDSPQWSSHGVHDPFGSGWNDYQGAQMITGCNGSLYLVATHKNGKGEDWVDLWQVSFDQNRLDRPRVEKRAKRHMYCSNEASDGERYCNFQAGAGSWVSPDGELLLYGVEHYNDICSGYGVKFREFPSWR